MPGSSCQCPGRRRRRRGRPRCRSIAQRRLGGGEAGVPPRVHRRGAGVRGLAAEAEPVALDPGAARDRARPQSLRLEHRALLDVELEVGAEPARVARGPRGRRVELDAVLGQDLGDRAASASVSEVELFGDQGAGEGGAAEEAAAEPGALLVGPVDSTRARGGVSPAAAQARSTPEPGDHAERPVEPAAVGHRVEVGADGQRRRTSVGARRAGPEVARLVDARSSSPSSASSSQSSRAGRPPARRPSRAAGRPRRPRCGRSARAGRRSRGRRRSPARRSPLSRRGSRRSACPRQWAPPPPSVNIERSGSKTSSPSAGAAR